MHMAGVITLMEGFLVEKPRYQPKGTKQNEYQNFIQGLSHYAIALQSDHQMIVVTRYFVPSSLVEL